MLRRNVQLAPLTSLQVGGRADFLARVSSPAELEAAWNLAEERKLPTFFLGEGTNVLFADEGFSGVVVRNEFLGRTRYGGEILVGGGENLPALIRWINRQGLAGMQRMYGIPGTLAGAIVGNAGAYGQEISQVLKKVIVWTRGELSELDVQDLRMAYRHSRFKDERDKFIVSCILKLKPEARDLLAESEGILRDRERKYPAGLRCPGSFFKNLPWEDLAPEIQERIPPDFVLFGKVPAGKLLEAVGANGSRVGDAGIASYHGNLVVNRGTARARDILALAETFALRVYERFGISLEPEIRIAGQEFPTPEERRRLHAGRTRRNGEVQN